MKRVIFVLAFVGLTLAGFSQCQYQTQDGSDRCISVDSVAWKFSNLFDEAISNPGDTIFAKSNFFVKFIGTRSIVREEYLQVVEGITFDNKTNSIIYIRKNLFIITIGMIIFVLVSIISMLIANLFFVGKNKYCSMFFMSAMLFVITLTIGAFIFFAFAAAVAFTFACIVAFIATMACIEAKKTKLAIASAIYYIAIITGLILLYLR